MKKETFDQQVSRIVSDIVRASADRETPLHVELVQWDRDLKDQIKKYFPEISDYGIAIHNFEPLIQRVWCEVIEHPAYVPMSLIRPPLTWVRVVCTNTLKVSQG